ncbi:MAG: hypothetical protein ACON42_07460 [Flavobacteriaceae bacterium]
MEIQEFKPVFRQLYVEAYDLLYDCKRQAPSLEAALPLFRDRFDLKAQRVLESSSISAELKHKLIGFYQEKKWWIMGYNEALKSFSKN